MQLADFNRATHFSLVWAFMLSFVTLVEWRSLDREPLKKDILSPFIQRDITILQQGSALGAAEPQYLVSVEFNGPLFLACFLVPIILFHLIGMLLNRFRSA